MANDIEKKEETEQEEILPNLFKIDRITKPNCKICSSEHRDFAENLYDSQRKKNYAEIRAALETQFDFKVSEPSIKNHIIYHHKARENNENLKEYAQDLQKWIYLQKDKVGALKNRIAVLEREMFSLAQMGDDLSLEERRKNADIINKLAVTILTHNKEMKEFVDEEKPIQLVFNQLKLIVNEELRTVESAKAQQAIFNIFKRLKESIGDIET